MDKHSKIRAIYYLECDLCGKRSPEIDLGETFDIGAANAELNNQGWHYHFEDVMLCPEHAKQMFVAALN